MNKDSTEEKKEKLQTYPVIEIRGLLFPEILLIPSYIENLIDYKPQKDEIYIVTYPKCGTTWTQYLVWEILHKGAIPPNPNQIMFKYIPFLEFTGIDVIKDLPEPKVMKTHLPFHLHPYSPLAKYIYIVRNPWDCCVSYYHHHCLEPDYPQLTFDQYFDLFVSGQLGWGSFFDHVCSWFSHKNDPNVLFLSYEDMKKNTKQVLLQIAEFLGENYLKDLQDEEVLQNCLKYSDFNYLKTMGMYFPKDDGKGNEVENVKNVIKKLGEIDRNHVFENFEEVPFFRKGTVGDWANYFSQEQIKIFNNVLIDKFKNTGLDKFWKPVDEETSF